MAIFNDLDLKELGHTIQVEGVVYGDGDKHYVCLLPEDSCILGGKQLIWLGNLTHEDWKDILRQTDLQETEILAKDTEGRLVKAVVRKSTRQIEQGVSWRVYKRDNYRCRYCGRDNVPLTVDHLVLWEDGGPSIEENLVACCKKCNKTRGRTPYKDWLQHPYYRKASKKLSVIIRDENQDLVDTLDKIPLRIHKKSR